MSDRRDIIHYQRATNAKVVATDNLSPRLAPEIVRVAGPSAEFAWEEFFQGEIANFHTRKNYLHAVGKFLAWADNQGIELVRITPGDVGSYFQEMKYAVLTKNSDEMKYAIPTKKLHLSALRKFFDRLVNRHVIVINPAATVRTERYSNSEGKTRQIPPEHAKNLLASIRTAKTGLEEPEQGLSQEVASLPDLIGLRDKAILAVLIYTAARVGAVSRLTLKSLQHDGRQYTLRFAEKGGKSREIPVRHDVELLLLGYIKAANITEGPLFRSAKGKTDQLTDRPTTAIDICRMMKRRLHAAGLSTDFSPHSFRVTTITDLLEQNQSLEDVQQLAGHADPRTTRLYDRRGREVTRNLVERISI